MLCLTDCTNKNATNEHEAVTILAPYLDCDCLAELVHEKYPEVNLEILSSVEGTTAIYEESKLKSNLLPFKDWSADDTYYGDIADEINAGNTARLFMQGGKIHWQIQEIVCWNTLRIRQRLKMLLIS